MKPDIIAEPVVVASGNSSPTNISFTPPVGYKFVCWVGVSSQGFIGTPYLESYNSASTKIWDRNPGAGTYRAIALCAKT